MTKYGIDYGRGLTNIDHKTGIRYGVIPVSDIIFEDFEPVYILSCDNCGYDNDCEYGQTCPNCGNTIEYDDFQDPIALQYITEEYRMFTDSDCIDVFIEKSPYYTYASFCSPCAPGVCYLRDAIKNDRPENNKCYCLPPEFFKNEKTPYIVYEVKP